MTRILLSGFVFLLALGANVALFLRHPAHQPSPAGHVRLTLGEHVMEVPRSLLRDPEISQSGRYGRVELVVAIADFSPLPAPSPLNPEDTLPDAITIVMSAAVTGAAEPFQALYARFLSGETKPVSSGLVIRRFRTGTPFDDRDLFIGAGSRLFVALCAKEAQATQEPCLATIKHEGLDIQLRFNRKYLPEWRRLTQEVTRMIGQIDMRV